MKFKPKIIKLKPIKINFNFDIDRDGVVDRKDCRPFNPFKQHVSNTTMNRIKSLKLGIISEDEIQEPIPFSKAKKYAPRGYREIISLFKTYPNLLGKAERLTKTGEFAIFYDANKVPAGQPLGRQTNHMIYVRKRYQYYEKPPKTVEYRDDEEYKKLLRSETASSMFHEMKHEDQERRDPKFGYKYDSYMRKNVPSLPRTQKEAELYYMNPYEAEAMKYGDKKTIERELGYTDSEVKERRKSFFKLIEENE